MSGGYIKPCGCDEDESCDVCHPPRYERAEEARLTLELLKAKQENERLRDTLELIRGSALADGTANELRKIAEEALK